MFYPLLPPFTPLSPPQKPFFWLLETLLAYAFYVRPNFPYITGQFRKYSIYTDRIYGSVLCTHPYLTTLVMAAAGPAVTPCLHC